MVKFPNLRGKISKRGIVIAIFFTVLAIGVAQCSNLVTGSSNFTWKPNTQLQYQSFSNNTPATYLTFTLKDVDFTNGVITTSWNARPYDERFYLGFTNRSFTTFSNGTPAVGSSEFGGKIVTWLNKTDILSAVALNTTYMAKFIEPGHNYYYLIDNDSGVIVQFGDRSTGQVLMKLIEWPEHYLFNWDIFFTIAMATGFFLIFVSVFRYGVHELKVAPHNRFRDRAGNYLSALLFAGILTAVVLFIITIVLQAISVSWIFGLNIGVAFGNSQYKPLSSSWQTDVSVLQALQWPTLIPVLVVLIGTYVSIYPFFDLLNLPRRGSDKPMEIHQALDSHLLGRIKFPLNYFIVAGILAAAYILPTFLIYEYFAPILPGAQSDPTLVLILVMISWFAVPSFVFLHHYASIGVASMFWTGYTRGFKAKDKVDNTFNIIVFVIALVLITSISFNFVNVIVELASGTSPIIISENPSGSAQFFTVLITFFIRQNILDSNREESLWRFQQFFSVIPFDLLLFFITVCAVGLYGFYSKFLSKEPLNRPVLLSFACYIVAAVGLEVFVNVILRLPNAFTGGIFDPHFTNPNGFAYGSQEYNDAYFSSFDGIRQLFFIPYFADKIFLFIFLMYNLVFNKRLRENVRERILAIAAQRERIDILSKFTTAKDRRTQRIVLENVLRILEKNPGESGKIANIVNGVISSEDPTLNALANKVLYFLSTILPIQDLEHALLTAITSKSAFVRDAVGENLMKIGMDDPEKIARLYADVVTSELPDESLEFLATIMKRLMPIRPEIPAIVLIPFLDMGADTPRGGGLKILKTFNALNLQDNRGDLILKLTRIITEKSESQAQDAIELLSTLGAAAPEKMSEILVRLEELHEKGSAPVKRRIIRAEVSFIIASPDRAGEIFPKLFAFLGDISPEVRNEVSIGMSQVGKIFKKGENFLSIRKIIARQLKDFDEDVRAGGVKALAEVGTANPQLLKEPEFKELLNIIINESSDVVRDAAVDLFTEFSKATPSMEIFLLPLRILEDSQESAKKVHPTALRILNRIIGTFPKDAGIDLVLNPVITFDRRDEKNRREIAGILFDVARTRPETAERIYPVLQELVNDRSEVVASIATRAITEIILSKIAKPGLQFSVSLDTLVDLVLTQCVNRKAGALTAAIESAITIYKVNKAVHSRIYPVFLELVRKFKRPILIQVVPVLTSIVCDNKTDYAGKTVTKEFLPALLEGMGKTFTEFARKQEAKNISTASLESIKTFFAKVKSVLNAALDAIVASFSEAAKDMCLFLLTAVSLKKGADTRIMAISALGKFPGATEDVSVALALVANTSIIRSRQFRRAAMEAIKDLIATFPAPEKLSTNQKISLQVLTAPMLRWKGFFYIRDFTSAVRKAYAEVLATIGAKQLPLAKKVLPCLSTLTHDREESISLYVAQEFFNIVHQYPELLDVAVQEFPIMCYSPHDATRKLLLDEILALLEKGAIFAHVVPSLILLAGDENETFRRTASQEFQTLVDKNQAEIPFFTESLLVSARDAHKQSREGAAMEIPIYIANHPIEKKGLEELLQAFLGLARDPAKSVRSAIAFRLPDLVKMTPPDQVNVIFQTLFRLIREDERATKNSVVEAFRAIAAKYPNRIPEIVPDLNQVNRKVNLAALDDLIKEITGKERVQPEDAIKAIVARVQKWWKSRGKNHANPPVKLAEDHAKPIDEALKPAEVPFKRAVTPAKQVKIPAKATKGKIDKEEPKKDV